MKHYLIPVTGDVEPSLIGPFDTSAQQIMAAQKTHAEQEEEDSLFWLDIAEDGTPQVGAFDPLAFEEAEDEDEGYDDGKVLIAGQLYDEETGWEAEPQ